MSWRYFPASAVEFLEQSGYVDSKQSVMLKSMNTVYPSSKKESQKAILTMRQSGTMPEPLTVNRGMEKWILSQRDSRVSHFPLQDNAKDQTTAGTCGQIPFALLEKLDPDTHSSKTSQDSSAQWIIPQKNLFHTLELYCEIWPKQGMMQSGQCWEQMMSVPRIDEKGCGYWPTPCQSDIRPARTPEQIEMAKQKGGCANLREHVMWPTPTTAEATKIPAQANYGQIGLNNHPLIRGSPQRGKLKKDKKGFSGGTRTRQTYRTPNSTDWKNRGQKEYREGRQIQLQTQIQGSLNPSWVEWLMGVPIEWTALKDLAMHRFRQWLQGHGIFCTTEYPNNTQNPSQDEPG